MLTSSPKSSMKYFLKIFLQTFLQIFPKSCLHHLPCRAWKPHCQLHLHRQSRQVSPKQGTHQHYEAKHDLDTVILWKSNGFLPIFVLEVWMHIKYIYASSRERSKSTSTKESCSRTCSIFERMEPTFEDEMNCFFVS